MVACEGSTGGSGGGVAPPTAPGGSAATFEIAGDPEAAGGAQWTYRGTNGGVTYDLQGVLLKPRGPGPFPAVIISHGKGGSANGYSRGIAADLVSWGLVCIGTNYTHAGGVPLGAPGSAADEGASDANVLRALRVLDILASLGYVDASRVAAHGHSMGAFVTAALAGAHSSRLRVASHTAGGSLPGENPGTAAPVEGQVRGIRIPYQLHHGDADIVVPLTYDVRLAGVLRAQGVPFELVVYPGAEHNDVARDAAMLASVRTWYAAHGMF